MNTKYINSILVVIIILVVGIMGFFAWKLFSNEKSSEISTQTTKQFTEPIPLMNKGKESEDRDAVLERDVRVIHDAVIAYAQDHDGLYPESHIKNPCSFTRYCLKGIDINTKEKIYLPVVPQVQPNLIDYYYRANNQEKSFCVVTASLLETDHDKVFQCTESSCGRVLAQEQCQ